MIEFFIKRPVTTLMFVLTFVIIGAVSFLNLKLEKQPKIDFPIITVFLSYPGSTSNEIESQLIEKVESSLSELSGIKRMHSVAFDNVGYVFIEFILSSNIDTKYIEVKSKVESLINKLPSNIKKPIVEKFDPFVTPVMDIALSCDYLDKKELYSFADSFKKHFLSIPGVANVEIFGGNKRQINISLNPLLMKKHYISIEDVIKAIQDNNQNMPVGILDNKSTTLSVRCKTEINKIEDLSNILLVTGNFEKIFLKDIAEIKDSFEKIEKEAHFNSKEVVGLSIIKNPDANAKDISKAINKNLNFYRSMLKDKMSLSIVNDNSLFIVYENNQAILSILIGIFLTILILFLFTGNSRLILIASITIPISIISSFFLMDISNFSINFMTLLAISSALGTLIANTIVIIENFWKHLLQGKDSYKAALDGTKEISVALLASCGTNIVVFTPIAFMDGIIGQFMKSFGLTVVYLTIFSLIVSFTLTPMLCCKFLQKKQKQNKISFLSLNLLNFLKKKYEIFFHKIFKYPNTTLLVVFIIFLSLRFIMPYIGNDFFPKTDQNKIYIDIKMPDGSSFHKTKETTKKIEEKIKNRKDVFSYFSKIGKNKIENAEITLNLVPLKKRNKKDTEIVEDLTHLLSDVVDADIILRTQDKKGFDEGDIVINLTGPDHEKVIALSKKFKKEMIKSNFFRSVHSSFSSPKKEIIFLPNQENLIENGIESFKIGGFLRSSIYGNKDLVFKENKKEHPINIYLDEKYISNATDLTSLEIISRKGSIPLMELGEFNKKDASSSIYHRDKKRILQLSGYLASSDTGHVRSFLKKVFKKIPIEEDYKYSFAGDAEHADESQIELLKAFILAVLLTYVLLCAIMNSFLYPIAIIFSIITSFIGVFYSLFFLEESINIASMLGMVMLVGLVINNSILLLDKASFYIKENMDIKKALLSASKDRFFIIIITSFAIILGVIPQLFSIMNVKSSMGAVIIGGMSASLIFTFIVTPIIFYYLEKIKRKVKSN